MVTLFLECPLHLNVEVGAGDRHHGDKHKYDHRQGKIDSRKYDKGHRGLQKGDKKLFRTMVGELRHIEQIAGDPGHDLSHLRIVEIIIRQLLQMFKRILTHIRLNGGAHHMACVRHIEAGQTVHNPEGKVEHTDAHNRLNGQ